jgi:hypothetical protein
VLALINEHIAAVDAAYRPALMDARDRMPGIDRLLAHFDEAVSAFRRHGRRQVSGVIERVNELAVAHKLLSDSKFHPAIIDYEPAVLNGPKFDFQISGIDGQVDYLEVKTIGPRAARDVTDWRVNTYRGRRLPQGTHSPGESYSAARASFQKYTVETEAKLAAHAAVRPGRGWLVMCGDGVGWQIEALEHFAAFYRTGQHRCDDPLPVAELHAMAKDAVTLSRTLAGFAAIVRPQAAIAPTAWIWPC